MSQSLPKERLWQKDCAAKCACSLSVSTGGLSVACSFALFLAPTQQILASNIMRRTFHVLTGSTTLPAASFLKRYDQ